MSLIFVQNNLVLLKSIPNDFLTKPGCIIYNNELVDEFINMINKPTEELVFIYNNINNIPFFTHNKGDYSYFSNDIIKLFQHIKNLTGTLKVNLITQNINNQQFIAESQLIEKNLGINIETNYNIENIIPHNKVLLENTYGVTLNKLPSEYFKVTKNKNGGYDCKLLKDINISDIGFKNSNFYIQLNNYDTFNGDTKLITVTWINNGIFGINCDSKDKLPIIKNLKVDSIQISGGGIIRNNSRYFKISNCQSTGQLLNNSGGICGIFPGKNLGYCEIDSCSFDGSIGNSNEIPSGESIASVENPDPNQDPSDSGNKRIVGGVSRSGGICSYGAGFNGICKISNCTITSTINGNYCGNICADSAGMSNGYCSIDNCIINKPSEPITDPNGNIIDPNGNIINPTGTITGKKINKSNKKEINKLKDKIINNKEKPTTTDTVNTIDTLAESIAEIKDSINQIIDSNNQNNDSSTPPPALYGLYNGGICGKNAGADNGECIITNCQFTGNIEGSYNGGICGPNAGSGGKCTIANCIVSGDIYNAHMNNHTGSSGGICANYAGNYYGNCTIIDCEFTGLIQGSNSGGICGSYTADNHGKCTINNCNTFISNIDGVYNGGICGSNSAINNAQLNISKCKSNIDDCIGMLNGGIIGYKSCINNSTCNISDCDINCVINGSNNGCVTAVNTGIYNSTCNIVNCNIICNIKGNYNSGICCGNIITDPSNVNNIRNISNCSVNCNIEGLYNGGIIGYDSAIFGTSSNKTNIKNSKSGTTTIDNCNTNGNIYGLYNGGIIAGNKYNAIYDDHSYIIKNSYSTINFYELQNGGFCYNLYNKNLFIENSYYLNNKQVIPLINLIDTKRSNIIISNSYTTSNNLINNCINSNLYIFNTYAALKFVNNQNTQFYYNNFDVSSNYITTQTSLTPITNQIDLSSQVGNIGSINNNGTTFTPTKWDIVNIWNVPTLNIKDNSIYPTLKTNP